MNEEPMTALLGVGYVATLIAILALTIALFSI